MTEERAMPDLPPAAPTSDDARAALAAEWQAAAPRTDDEIARFYQESRCLGADLDAWHADPRRQAWTDMLVHVAKESASRVVVDIGAGAGHDLHALWAALDGMELHGVEPNRLVRERHADIFSPYAAVADAPIEAADLLICIDVLEHVPDPTSFLAALAQRARVGCLLFEATATFDLGTPLHLPANRGWHPGPTLERHGWRVIDKDPTGRVRVWRREAEAGPQTMSLLLCAYRAVSAETMGAIFALCAGATNGWRLRMKNGDALISRSRSIVVTKWWQETNDDVFLMVDDDIVFNPADADRLVELCRAGHDIICAAYPVHNGGHLAAKCFAGTTSVHFGPDQPPLEIRYAATGFMAVHRRVIDAMVATMPLCHPNEPWSFYPLFQSLLVEEPGAGTIQLSEDWGFVEKARWLGFKCWMDPSIKLTHLGHCGISVNNMAQMFSAINAV